MRANRPSMTALEMPWAMVLCSESERYKALVPPEAARLARLFLPQKLAALAEFPAFRSVQSRFENGLMPGVNLHLALRKRFLEDQTRRVLAEGFRQLVVIGAGYDTLALRLAREAPELLAIEVDHPATQSAKRESLASESLPANLVLVAADLATKSLGEALRGVEAFDATCPTLFIAEGLLMYLREPAVARLFQEARAAASARIRFLFSYITPTVGKGEVSLIGKRSVAWALRLIGEPIEWMILPTALSAFLAEHGFELGENADTAELCRRYFPAATKAEQGGVAEEWLAGAEVRR